MENAFSESSSSIEITAKKKWVEFEDDRRIGESGKVAIDEATYDAPQHSSPNVEPHTTNDQINRAVLPTESVHIKMTDIRLTEHLNVPPPNCPMRSIELDEVPNGVRTTSHSSIRQGFGT